MGLGRIFDKITQAASHLTALSGPQQDDHARPPLVASPLTPSDTGLLHVAQQVADQQESPLLIALRQISPATLAKRNVFEYAVKVSDFPKPPEQMTLEDYNLAAQRAQFRATGLHDVTDSEVRAFRYQMQKITGGNYQLGGTLEQLQEAHRNYGEFQAGVSDWGIAVLDVGKREIYRQRQEHSARTEQARADSHKYGEEALVGFYKIQANGGINVVNYASKIVGAPEIPKFQVSGEYWHDKKQVAEGATTIAAAVTTGQAGAVGTVLTATSTATALTEGATGTDLRTGAELTPLERTASVVGGVVGAKSLSQPAVQAGKGIVNGLKQTAEEMSPTGHAVVTNTGAMFPARLPSSTANSGMQPARPETTQGVRLPVQATDEALTKTTLEARSRQQLSGGRGLKFEDEALAQAKAVHREGFKPDVETQRLGLTHRAAADYVGLEKTKSGNYIAHITEITVKNKSLSELGKQLDGAQKIASAKLGEQIDDYRYYIRTNNKELVEALAKEKNLIRKPGAGSGDAFKVTVIFEGGGK